MTVISESLSVGNIALLVGLVAFGLLAWRSGFVRYIPNSRIGVVEKLWALKGSVTKGLIALDGEAGFQPAVLRGGGRAASNAG